MMILGIDFGLKNIGLAISSGELAEPLLEFKVTSLAKTLTKIQRLCQQYEVDKIVLGLPDGPIEKPVKKFASQLRTRTGLPVIFQDETLTSHEAVKKSLHMSLKKRRQSRHAVAASLILQLYLDR